MTPGSGATKPGLPGSTISKAFGIPAAAIGHDTARIGDGPDMMARGLVTHANAPARTLGCRPG